jgi:hypothetical protein
MTKDTGTLLAQVIPVLGVALGIELRAAAAQISANRREGARLGTDPAVAYYGVGVAVILAAGELVAIAAANGVRDLPWTYLWASSILPGSGLLGLALTISIVAVFLLPAQIFAPALFIPVFIPILRSVSYRKRDSLLLMTPIYAHIFAAKICWRVAFSSVYRLAATARAVPFRRVGQLTAVRPPNTSDQI